MSADLFAAFEDASQPPPQQPRSKPPSTQSASTPFAFGSISNPLAANPTRNQQWSQVSPASNSNQFRHSWQPQPSPAPSTPPAWVATSAFANTQPIDNDDAEDDDGWGDFEVAPDTAPSPAPLQVAPTLANAKQPIPVGNAAKRPTRIVRASTMELVSNSLVDLQEPSIQPSRPAKPPVPLVKPSSRPPPPKVQAKSSNVNPNVLFDADDFDGEQENKGSDDDFGEFETVPTPAQPSPDLLSSGPSVHSSNTNTAKKASELLLDLDMNKPTPKPAQTTQTKLSRSKPYSGTTQPRNTHTHTKSQPLEDEWGSVSHLPKQPVRSQSTTVESTWDWDSVESPKPAKPENSTKKTSKLTSNNDVTITNDDTAWDWDPVDTKTETVAEIEDSSLPPINIPPPSILLSAFPQLFDQAHEYLYKPVSGQPQSIKDRVLSDTKVYDFLSGYLSLAVVAARIIAGRRMRWHRDKFLSQSMSISAAGSKGMKLAGVDKTQTVREDREAADIVSNWKGQIGRLRSMVASANSAKKSGGKQLKVPEITDTMQVQTAKDVPTASKACVICGLKRNERLAKVDNEVEDSFGEWWVEHWGHVSCKRFWLRHENTLRQR
ncbi:hypothetical protein F4801DRAFT_495409 [Xylaria longipes]|nr:hypothetical protein F4801DRAFT_495409 [Xylaria longipes]RYC61188.1 hypothetical protein CHU98_g5015 [Xylaria longipes]